MKILVFIIDFIVLGGLIAGVYAFMDSTHSQGGIFTRSLLVGIAGCIFYLLRNVYRKHLLPDETDKD